MRTKNTGFTLIELLVVIAIIGLLSTIVMTSLNSARKKGRDTRRVEDLNQIRQALEMYYDSSGSYPTSTAALSAAGYLSVVPNDPNGSAYTYAVDNTTNPQDFVLAATLEQTNAAALNNDVDGTHYTVNCDDPVYCVMP